MKKLTIMFAVICVAVGAAAAYAGPDDDWYVYVRAASPGGAAVLNNCIFGTRPGYTDSPAGTEDKSQSNNGIAPAIGAFDLGSGNNGTGYYQDLRSPIGASGALRVWNIRLWALGGYGYSDIALSAWNPVGSHDVGGGIPIRLKVVHDPSGTFADGCVLIDAWDPNKNGVQDTPAYSWVFSGAGALKDASNPIVLQLIASYDPLPASPEPGSMVAMLSGLAGLVGFGVRRRK